jgi:hypothetical protein
MKGDIFFNGRFREADLEHRLAVAGRQRAKSDYSRQVIDPLTSTPHQPANACFAPSLLLNVAENGPV